MKNVPTSFEDLQAAVAENIRLKAECDRIGAEIASLPSRSSNDDIQTPTVGCGRSPYEDFATLSYHHADVSALLAKRKAQSQ